MATLPEDNPCEEVKLEDETLYVCDGVLYRPTYYKDELVYEIVSDEKDAPIPPPESAPASGGDLRLTSPPMSGPGVAALQGALATRGFDPGGTDGIFGQGTDRALRAYQEAEGLPVTGVLDEATAAALGL